jgi:hypothetical protein
MKENKIMPKILVNYTYNKKKDTYSLIDNGVVFVDMPIAVMELGAQYDEILIVPINQQNTVVDKEEYLNANKRFKLAVDEEGNVKEDDNGAFVWLPKNTDVSKLKVINNQLILVEESDE